MKIARFLDKDNVECIFICESQDTRNGFRHVLKNGFGIQCKMCYLNRTYERYQYQSLLQKAIEKLKLIPLFNIETGEGLEEVL